MTASGTCVPPPISKPAEVALAYKQLWMVEDIFRSMKSLLEARPIYHRTEAQGVAGKAFQAAGVALPPTLRKVS